MSMVVRVGVSHLAHTPSNQMTCVLDGMGASACEPKVKEQQITSEQCSTPTPLVRHGIPYQFVLQDHNYGAPPPPSPPPPPLPPPPSIPLSSPLSISPIANSRNSSSRVSPKVNGIVISPTVAIAAEDEDDTNNSLLSVSSATNEEANTGEQAQDSVTRCICEFDHDDEYMICCDNCLVWQHVDCMGLDRSNIPETYMCEICQPRKVDKQKAKALQTKKRGEMTDSSSEESSTDASHRNIRHSLSSNCGSGQNNQGSGRPKKIGRRRKTERNSCSSSDLKAVSVTKRRGRTKDKMDMQTKRIYTKRKVIKNLKTRPIDFVHVSEDAQDVDLRKWIDNYEEAMTNSYSPELILRLSNLKFNGQHEDSALRTSFQPGFQDLCRVARVVDGCKVLRAIERVAAGRIVCEYRGKFLLGSQLRRQNPIVYPRSSPYVLHYHLQVGSKEKHSSSSSSLDSPPGERASDQVEQLDEIVCVDARDFGNIARFARRSCDPNVEVRHLMENGSLHLYLISLREIQSKEEITIPFDFDYNLRDFDHSITCACSRENCKVNAVLKRNGICDGIQEKDKKRRRRKSHSVSIETDDNSQCSVVGSRVSQISLSIDAEMPANCNGSASLQSPDESQGGSIVVDGSNSVSSTTTTPVKDDESLADRRKMVTREERKMEAIMKAFERMEKAEQRRQEAQARLQQRKEEQEHKKKELDEKRKDDPATSSTTPPVAAASSSSQTNSEVMSPANGEESTISQDEDIRGQVIVTVTPQTLPPQRHKGKGRKRKASGTPGRRNSRTNSGGSEILSQDENSQQFLHATSTSLGSLASSSSSSTVPAVSFHFPGLHNNNDSILPPSSSSTSLIGSSSNDVDANNISLSVVSRFKTKKLLMNEWFSDCSVDPIRREGGVVADPTCASPNPYLRRCRSPSGGPTGGIGSLHLRRTSFGECSRQQNSTLDGSLGSAKKRWLRQAMNEDVESSLPNGCASPTPNGTGTSPSTPPLPDLITPLKKRRLARESDTATPPSPVVSDLPPDTTDGNYEEDNKPCSSSIPSDSFATSSSLSSVAIKQEPTQRSSDALVAAAGIMVDAVLTNESFGVEVAEDLRVAQNSRLKEKAETVEADGSSQSVEVPSSSTEDTTVGVASNSVCIKQEEDVIKERIDESHVSVSMECESDVSEMCSSNNDQEAAVDLTMGSSNLARTSVSTDSILDSTSPRDRSQRKEAESTGVTSTAEEFAISGKDISNGSLSILAEAAVADSQSESVNNVEAVTIEPASSSSSSFTLSSNEMRSEAEAVAAFVSSSPPPPPPPPGPPPSLSELRPVSLPPSSLHAVSPPSMPSSSAVLSHSSQTSVHSSPDLMDTGSSSPSSVSNVSTPTSAPTTPTKRKVSLLEYRKRKLENSSSSGSKVSSDCTSTDTCTLTTSPSSDTVSVANTTSTPLSPVPSTSSNSSIQQVPVLPETTDKSKPKLDSNVKWDSTATSAERQRENLNQRLRREFGLLTDDEPSTSSASSATSTSSINSREKTATVTTAIVTSTTAVASCSSSCSSTVSTIELPWCPTWGPPPPPPPPPFSSTGKYAADQRTNSDSSEVFGIPPHFPISPQKVLTISSHLNPAAAVQTAAAQPMFRNISTIVGVRQYGVVRTAAAPPFVASYGIFPRPVLASNTLSTSTVGVLPAPPPPPPPPPMMMPPQPPLTRAPIVPFTDGQRPHNFNIHYPRIPLQLPPPPPPPPPLPPMSLAVVTQVQPSSSSVSSSVTSSSLRKIIK